MPRGKIIVSYTGADGKGYFEPDAQVTVEDLPGGATIRRISNIPQVPIPSVAMGGEKLNASVTNDAGITFLDCEMAPGRLSPMHATPSIDFGVMISGEIVLILDSGEEKILRPGDIYIQKAANHAWQNRSPEPALFSTVLVAARPAQV